MKAIGVNPDSTPVSDSPPPLNGTFTRSVPCRWLKRSKKTLENACRRIGQRFGLRFCQRCQFVQSPDVERRVGENNLRVVKQVHDRDERSRRVRNFLVQKLVGSQRLSGENAERVSIRRRLSAGSAADDEVAAGARLDDKRLA